MEFGIFNDEGLVVAGFFDRAEADAACASIIGELEPGEGNGELYVAEICPDHEEYPREGCELCNALDEHDEQE